MSVTLKVDMWQDGQKILLEGLLSVLHPPAPLRWRICRFKGVGVFPASRTYDEFLSLIKEREGGYEFVDEEFDEFVKSLRDITDIVVVGSSGSCPVLRIEGEDSTTWYITREVAEGSSKP